MAAHRLRPYRPSKSLRFAVGVGQGVMHHFRRCQHTKDDGELCGSPAMRRQSYCYFHLEMVLRGRRRARIAKRRQLLVETALVQRLFAAAKLLDDRILALKSNGLNTLDPYFCATFPPSRLYTEGGGRGVDRVWLGAASDQELGAAVTGLKASSTENTRWHEKQ